MERSAHLARPSEPLSEALIFPADNGRAMTSEGLSKLCRELQLGTTPHGCRATFKTWAAEAGHDRQVVELCMGHAIKGIERHYLRADLFDRRREVMEAWADHLAGS